MYAVKHAHTLTQNPGHFVHCPLEYTAGCTHTHTHTHTYTKESTDRELPLPVAAASPSSASHSVVLVPLICVMGYYLYALRMGLRVDIIMPEQSREFSVSVRSPATTFRFS